MCCFCVLADFIDLLTVVATAHRLDLELTFGDDEPLVGDPLAELLVDRMRFTKITVGLTQDAQDAMDVSEF